MPRVLNRKTEDPTPDSVYVGRPSKWGNPFRIGKDAQGTYWSREQVVELYRSWLPQSGLDPKELRGKDLVCWCAPLTCHADVLLEIANSEDPKP